MLHSLTAYMGTSFGTVLAADLDSYSPIAASAGMPDPLPRSRMRFGRRYATGLQCAQAALRRGTLAAAEGEATPNGTSQL